MSEDAFKGYGKIYEDTKHWQISSAQQSQFKKVKWVVTGILQNKQ